MTSDQTSSRGTAFAWTASAKEAGVLLLVAVLATGGFWVRNPERLPLRADPAVYELELEAPLVPVDIARKLYDEGAHLFVDTRPPAAGETIPGSLYVREDTFDDDLVANFDFMFPEDALILFGNGDLSRASNIAGRLKQRGFENVSILQGGLSAWKRAGGDTSPIAPEAGS